MHGTLPGQGLGLASQLGTPPSPTVFFPGSKREVQRGAYCATRTHSKRGTVVEIQSRLDEFPPSHVLMLSTRNHDSLWAEGGRDRGWVCRRGNPAVAEGPKGPGRAGCGCVGDCHRPVALRAKIAQGEVGSFRMNKACTGLVSDGSR